MKKSHFVVLISVVFSVVFSGCAVYKHPVNYSVSGLSAHAISIIASGRIATAQGNRNSLIVLNEKGGKYFEAKVKGPLPPGPKPCGPMLCNEMTVGLGRELSLVTGDGDKIRLESIYESEDYKTDKNSSEAISFKIIKIQ